MNFEQFKKDIIVLSGEEAVYIRELYIGKYINIESDRYKKTIEQRKMFSDGLCYTGYLWENLDVLFPQISGEFAQSFLEKQGDVFVFWDIHSADRIFIENYWKFEKNSVLSLSGKILLQGLKYLPEDIYIFPKDFSWSLIYTHEPDVQKRHIILFSES